MGILLGSIHVIFVLLRNPDIQEKNCNTILTQTEVLFTSKFIKAFGTLSLATLFVVVDSKPAIFASQTIFVMAAI